MTIEHYIRSHRGPAKRLKKAVPSKVLAEKDPKAWGIFKSKYLRKPDNLSWLLTTAAKEYRLAWELHRQVQECYFTVTQGYYGVGNTSYIYDGSYRFITCKPDFYIEPASSFVSQMFKRHDLSHSLRLGWKYPASLEEAEKISEDIAMGVALINRRSDQKVHAHLTDLNAVEEVLQIDQKVPKSRTMLAMLQVCDILVSATGKVYAPPLYPIKHITEGDLVFNRQKVVDRLSILGERVGPFFDWTGGIDKMDRMANYLLVVQSDLFNIAHNYREVLRWAAYHVMNELPEISSLAGHAVKERNFRRKIKLVDLADGVRVYCGPNPVLKKDIDRFNFELAKIMVDKGQLVVYNDIRRLNTMAVNPLKATELKPAAREPSHDLGQDYLIGKDDCQTDLGLTGRVVAAMEKVGMEV